MKKAFTWLFSIVLILLIIIAFQKKDVLNDIVAEKMKSMVDKEATAEIENLIDTKYNYSKNGLGFEYTIFEFSSYTCANCKKMEAELEKIKKSHTDQINIVFVNTTFPENQELIKYMGVPAIPLQIVLNDKGEEIFKHYGFISSEDLLAGFLKN